MNDLISALSLLIRGVLRLDPDVFQTLVASPNNIELALIALFIAGVSITLGQSVVLFANRVSRIRFLLSLVVSALILIMSVFFWALSTWAVLELVFAIRRPFHETFVIVAAGHAPLAFGFLVLLPYLGRIIHAALRVWTFLAVWVGVTAVYQMPVFIGLAVALLGWLLLEIVTHFLPVLDRMGDWLRQLATGQREMRSVQEMVDYYVERGRRRVDSAYKDQGGDNK